MSIKLTTIPINDDIHIDDLWDLKGIVTIDRIGIWDLFPETNDQGFVENHTMSVDLTYFEERVINFVEVQHTQEEIGGIVKGWKVPSYNLIKGFGIENGKKSCEYQVFVDVDGRIQKVVILTERNCEIVLN